MTEALCQVLKSWHMAPWLKQERVVFGHLYVWSWFKFFCVYIYICTVFIFVSLIYVVMVPYVKRIFVCICVELQ